jgi:hypothetical protein
MNIEGFLAYLERIGRSDSTLALYKRHLRIAEEHPKGVLGRVTDRRLAPGTRRTVLAILKSYSHWDGSDRNLANDLAGQILQCAPPKSSAYRQTSGRISRF